MEEWLKKAFDADADKRLSKAIDIVFDNFDRMLSKGEFREVDQLLREIPLNDVTLGFLMCVLSITLPANEFLPFRPDFFQLVWEKGEKAGRPVEQLLSGLKTWNPIYEL